MGKTYGEAREFLQVRRATVLDWCKKYQIEGLQEVIKDKPKSGRSLTIRKGQF